MKPKARCKTSCLFLFELPRTRSEPPSEHEASTEQAARANASVPMRGDYFGGTNARYTTRVRGGTRLGRRKDGEKASSELADTNTISKTFLKNEAAETKP